MPLNKFNVSRGMVTILPAHDTRLNPMLVSPEGNGQTIPPIIPFSIHRQKTGLINRLMSFKDSIFNANESSLGLISLSVLDFEIQMIKCSSDTRKL